MAKQFENDPPLSAPSPRSHIESRLIKADLDRRIAESVPRRPRIGALPPPSPNFEMKTEDPVDEKPLIEIEDSDETDAEDEVTAGTIASFVVPK